MYTSESDDRALTECGTGADLGAALLASDALGDKAVVIPPGYSIEDTERFEATPRRVREAIEAHTLNALIDYFDQFGGPASAVFVDERHAPPRVLLIVDYHEKSDAPAWGDHRVLLEMKHSEAWLAWTQKAKQPMNQLQFAAFVEDRAEDVRQPAGADLLTIVKSVEAVRNVEFSSRVDLDSGDVVFGFQSETKGRGTLPVPNRFTLGIEPFEGAEPYQMEARLRYRVSDGGDLTLWFELVRPRDVLEAAVNDVVQRLREATNADRVFRGWPSRPLPF